MWRGVRTFLVVVALVAVTAPGLLATPASATIIESTIDDSFGTGSGAGTFLTATFDDEDTAGSVILTIDVSTLNVGSKVLSFYFNYTGNPALLTFSFDVLNTADDPGIKEITTDGANCCESDGDGFYDIEFFWMGGAKFLQTETFDVTMSFLDLLATDFIDFSAPGGGAGNQPYCTSAHVADAGPNPNFDSGNPEGPGNERVTSDHFGGNCLVLTTNGTIPEPSTLALFAIGLVGLGVMTRRRRKQSV